MEAFNGDRYPCDSVQRIADHLLKAGDLGQGLYETVSIEVPSLVSEGVYTSDQFRMSAVAESALSLTITVAEGLMMLGTAIWKALPGEPTDEDFADFCKDYAYELRSRLLKWLCIRDGPAANQQKSMQTESS